MSLIINELTKMYGTQKAINKISFTAQRGEILGFLGPNGAGKSTTMKIATCYLSPTSGSVRVCGYDIVANPMEVRQKIGYLPEHNPLYLDMYVVEYLQFMGALYRLKGSQLRQRIQEMTALCGLKAEQHKKIGALSKGYRQRVGLAQALLHNPEVLILDEPTTGLDPNQIIEIRNLIKTVSQDKTVVFSTHIMQEVQALCNKVVIVKAGEIVANQTLANLQDLQNEVYITAEFAENPDLLHFEQIEGIKKIDKIAPTILRFTASKQIDSRANLFRAAVKANYTLLELKKEETTLEKVFYELTNEKVE
jgi:ABC-2 type transport system ATP-binding protein